MKIKSQLTLATLIVAGMFATGCQQMSQQTAQQAAPAATQEPAAAAAPTGENCHTHPPVPACTESITHCHPSNNPNHTHTYGCKGGHKAPAVPKVKAKGNYKGPVTMEQSSKEVMQQYQK